MTTNFLLDIEKEVNSLENEKLSSRKMKIVRSAKTVMEGIEKEIKTSSKRLVALRQLFQNLSNEMKTFDDSDEEDDGETKNDQKTIIEEEMKQLMEVKDIVEKRVQNCGGIEKKEEHEENIFQELSKKIEKSQKKLLSLKQHTPLLNDKFNINGVVSHEKVFEKIQSISLKLDNQLEEYQARNEEIKKMAVEIEMKYRISKSLSNEVRLQKEGLRNLTLLKKQKEIVCQNVISEKELQVRDLDIEIGRKTSELNEISHRLEKGGNALKRVKEKERTIFSLNRMIEDLSESVRKLKRETGMLIQRHDYWKKKTSL